MWRPKNDYGVAARGRLLEPSSTLSRVFGLELEPNGQHTMCKDTYDMEMCKDTCIDMCMDMWMDMWMGMCIDMCMNMCVDT